MVDATVTATMNFMMYLLSVVSTSLPQQRSISEPHRTALVLHVERGDARRPFLSSVCAHSPHERQNPLTMMQFPSSILVESGSISISC
jgi:hypothetical protein